MPRFWPKSRKATALSTQTDTPKVNTGYNVYIAAQASYLATDPTELELLRTAFAGTLVEGDNPPAVLALYPSANTFPSNSTYPGG